MTGSARTRRYLLSIPKYGGVKIEARFHDNEPVWLAPTLDRLRALLQLPEGWDSYQASAVSPAAIVAALRVLAMVMLPDTPPPSIVPLADGGVQLEWHQRGIDLELAIDARGRLEAAFADERTGRGWEAEGLTDLAPVPGAVARPASPDDPTISMLD